MVVRDPASLQVDMWACLTFMEISLPTPPPPSPKATLALTSHVGQNVYLGGRVGRWTGLQNLVLIHSCNDLAQNEPHSRLESAQFPTSREDLAWASLSGFLVASGRNCCLSCC